MASAHYDAGRYSEMEALLRNLAADHPAQGRPWNLLGVALLALRRNDEACEALARSVTLLPADVQALEHFGVALTRAGQPQQACDVLKQALAHASGARAREVSILDNLATACIAAQRWQEAETALRQALRHQPELAKPKFDLAVCLLMQGRVAEAVALLEKLTVEHPARVQGWALLSQARSQQEDWEAARGAAARAIACAPQAHKSHFLLANAERALGNLEACVTGARQALSLLRGEVGQPPPGAPIRARTMMPMEPARQVLREVRDRLTAAHLPFFLCAGTLLGIVRDGDLLPNDKDMDLGLPWHVNRARVLAALASDGAFVHVPAAADESTDNERLNLTLVHRETKIAVDLFFFRPDGDHVEAGFHQRPAPILSRMRRFDIGMLEWRGASWPVPAPAAQYLADLYGDEWRVPDPDFDTVLSSRCQTPASRDVRRCYGYLRLYERLAGRDWKKAAGYCRQLLWQQDDAFIRDLLDWLTPPEST